MCANANCHIDRAVGCCSRFFRFNVEINNKLWQMCCENYFPFRSFDLVAHVCMAYGCVCVCMFRRTVIVCDFCFVFAQFSNEYASANPKLELHHIHVINEINHTKIMARGRERERESKSTRAHGETHFTLLLIIFVVNFKRQIVRLSFYLVLSAHISPEKLKPAKR